MVECQIDPWLVLRTRSQHESAAERDLQQRSITAYLPRHNVVRRWRDRRTVLRMPLFPGYIFVRPRIDQFENIRCIRGSCGLVLSGSKPAAMPEKDVEAVKLLVSSGVDLAVNPRLIPGQKIQVVAGPFMGVQGELIRVKSQDRLVINAHLLGSSVSVEVDTDMISTL